MRTREFTCFPDDTYRIELSPPGRKIVKRRLAIACREFYAHPMQGSLRLLEEAAAHLMLDLWWCLSDHHFVIMGGIGYSNSALLLPKEPLMNLAKGLVPFDPSYLEPNWRVISHPGMRIYKELTNFGENHS